MISDSLGTELRFFKGESYPTIETVAFNSISIDCSILNETAAEIKLIFSYNTNYMTIALI